MAENISVENLVAVEDQVRTLVIQQYQLTLILITVLLATVGVLGFIGNGLVLICIGRVEYPRFFHRAFQLLVCCRCCDTDQHEQHIQSARVIPSKSVSIDADVMSTDPAQADAQHLNDMTEERKRKGRKSIFHRGKRTNYSKFTRSNSNLLILLLALNDWLICCFDIPTTMSLVVWESSTLDLICRLHVTFKAFTLTVCVFLLLLIAIDRWCTVCFVPSSPIPRPILFILIVLFYLIGLAWALPFAMHHGVISQVGIGASDLLINFSPRSDDQGMVEKFESNQKEERKFLPSVINQTLLNSLFNVGSCSVDERYFTGESYRGYQLSVFVLFSAVFTLISFIYGYIFLFVWWHHLQWKRRYGSSISSNSFSVQPPEGTWVHKHTSEYKITASVREHKSIDPHESIDYSVSASRSWCPDAETQTFTGVPHDISPAVDLLSHPYKCVPEFPERRNKRTDPAVLNVPKRRSTVKNRLNRGANNRHLKTAIMFILITVTFLISYFPSLLITNHFILEVHWEPDVVGMKLRNSTSVDSRSQSSAGQSEVTWTNHLRRVVLYLYFANTVTNPLVYFFLNSKFHDEATQLCRKLSSRLRS